MDTCTTGFCPKWELDTSFTLCNITFTGVRDKYLSHTQLMLPAHWNPGVWSVIFKCSCTCRIFKQGESCSEVVPETLAEEDMLPHTFRKELWKQSVSKVLKVRPRYVVRHIFLNKNSLYLHDERFCLSWSEQIRLWCWTFSTSLALVYDGLQ